ncbi:MAG TPA: RNA methyltransferase [Acidimicrobiales bacterium]|nr:RNA methyltransferase [Acidimicrobiales bacterium]
MTSPSDTHVVPYRDLKDSALRRSAELAGGVFVVEGLLALQAVLASPYPLRSLLVLRRRLEALQDLALPAGLPVYVADEDVMAATTGYNVHRGLLGLAGRLPGRSPADLLAHLASRVVMVVEGVNDQENLGAIFRNAAAFGAGAVLLDPTCADPLYRRSVRVSLGHVLRVPFARLSPWPASLELVRKWGFVPLALTPSSQAERIEVVSAELQGSRVALVVGGEGHGLSVPVLAMCRAVRIAMAGGVDSINVAAATAVALHCFGGDR